VSAASPTASVSYDGSNRQGFWLQGNSGSYSATVTVQLNITETKFNWCAYVSDYPPNAASYRDGSYTFKGTKPFIVNGTSVNDNKYAVTKITSLTDATGCPGGVGRDVIHNGGTCTSGLTSIGSYCRDLQADDARKLLGCGAELEVKNSYIQGMFFSVARYGCPEGWRPGSYDEYKCMHKTIGLVYIDCASIYVTTQTADAGWHHFKGCCNSGTSRIGYTPM
jgi:hypothetical protein